VKKPSTAGPGSAASPGSAAGPGDAAGPDEDNAARDDSDQAGCDDLNATLARAIWQFIAEVSQPGAVPSAM
jgi:hypothetical protein